MSIEWKQTGSALGGASQWRFHWNNYSLSLIDVSSEEMDSYVVALQWGVAYEERALVSVDHFPDDEGNPINWIQQWITWKFMAERTIHYIERLKGNDIELV